MKNTDRARSWVEKFVIAYTLCPFARAPYEAGRIKFLEISETNTEAILEAFWKEVEIMDNADATEISNSILVVPALSDSFEQYLDVFHMASELLEMQHKAGKFQLASFHPAYRFEGTTDSDPTNYTNRSPLPAIHILRVDEVANAIASHPDIDLVPVENQAKMKELGEEQLKEILKEFK